MSDDAFRVACVGEGFGPHDRRFLQAMVDASLEVTFIRLGRAPSDIQPIPDRVRTVTLGSASLQPGDWRGLVELLPELEWVLADVAPHVVQASPVQSAGLAAALAGARPLLVMPWAYDLLANAGRDATWLWASRFPLRRAVGVIVDSLALQQRVQELADLPPSRILQMPWGVDRTVFCPGRPDRGLREELGWAGHPMVVCTRSWEPVPGTNGWLFPVGSVTGLAECVMDALADVRRRAAIGARNAATIRARADWPTNFGRLLRLYSRTARRPLPDGVVQ